MCESDVFKCDLVIQGLSCIQESGDATPAFRSLFRSNISDRFGERPDVGDVPHFMLDIMSHLVGRPVGPVIMSYLIDQCVFRSSCCSDVMDIFINGLRYTYRTVFDTVMFPVNKRYFEREYTQCIPHIQEHLIAVMPHLYSDIFEYLPIRGDLYPIEDSMIGRRELYSLLLDGYVSEVEVSIICSYLFKFDSVVNFKDGCLHSDRCGIFQGRDIDLSSEYFRYSLGLKSSEGASDLFQMAIDNSENDVKPYFDMMTHLSLLFGLDRTQTIMSNSVISLRIYAFLEPYRLMLPRIVRFSPGGCKFHSSSTMGLISAEERDPHETMYVTKLIMSYAGALLPAESDLPIVTESDGLRPQWAHAMHLIAEYCDIAYVSGYMWNITYSDCFDDDYSVMSIYSRMAFEIIASYLMPENIWMEACSAVECIGRGLGIHCYSYDDEEDYIVGLRHDETYEFAKYLHGTISCRPHSLV